MTSSFEDGPGQERAEPAPSTDTRDRLYTTEELDRYTRQRDEAAAQASRPDPLSDPLADPLSDPLEDPLSDPWAEPGAAPVGDDDLLVDRSEAPADADAGSVTAVLPEVAGWPQSPAGGPPDTSTPPADPSAPPAAPLGPPPSSPPPSAPPNTFPSTPPPSTPPPGFAPPAPQPTPPSSPSSPSAPPPTPPPTPQPRHSAPAAQSAPPAPAPVAAPAPAPTSRRAVAGPPATSRDQESPAIPTEPSDPRRFMSATDFLDRRDNETGAGPATWGWQGRVRRWSGGLVTPRMSEREAAHEQDRAGIQKDFDGPRTIVFINPKGGAAKTTGVLAAGYTFGTVRGGGVVAWDNNETRGTLGIRGIRGAHRNTTRELLEDLGRFNDVYQSRIGDLGAFVRSQGDAHFDVLASDERPDVTGTIRADDFVEVHSLLERFYRIILVDTGNNMRAENWLAAAQAADLLVVTSTLREDTGYSGLWMLDALAESGVANLKYKTLTVLSDPSPTVDAKLASDLVAVYEQRTRGVYRVPYDPALVSGSVVPYAQLSEATRRSWLQACAGMAAAL